MRILVDENIPSITVHELRALGHDVLDIRGAERQGMLDDKLWPFAQTERRMLVTTDKGFSEHRDEQHFGILVVRLRQPNEQRIYARIMGAFRQFVEHDRPSYDEQRMIPRLLGKSRHLSHLTPKRTDMQTGRISG